MKWAVKDGIPHVWILEGPPSSALADEQSRIAVFASREDAEAWLVLRTIQLGWGHEGVAPVFLPDSANAKAWVHSLGELTKLDPVL